MCWRTESAFREVSRVVLASLAFTAGGAAAVIGCHAVWPTAFPALDELLIDPAYDRDQLRQVVTAAVVGAVVALVLAGLAHWVLAWKTAATRLRPVSLWAQAFREDCPPGTQPHAWVRVADGTMYVGMVRSNTVNLDLAGRELSLCPPLYVETPDGEMPPLTQWQRIVIPGTAIESIAVQYRSQP
jgi:hypothetical protein